MAERVKRRKAAINTGRRQQISKIMHEIMYRRREDYSNGYVNSLAGLQQSQGLAKYELHEKYFNSRSKSHSQETFTSFKI